MKTLISIPGNTATSVLKSLHLNRIACNYVGLDQAGRLIMEINYEPAQEELIKDLNEYMKHSEELLLAITASVNEALDKQRQELFRSLDELKKKHEENKKAKTVTLD